MHKVAVRVARREVAASDIGRGAEGRFIVGQVESQAPAAPCVSPRERGGVQRPPFSADRRATRTAPGMGLCWSGVFSDGSVPPHGLLLEEDADDDDGITDACGVDGRRSDAVLSDAERNLHEGVRVAGSSSAQHLNAVGAAQADSSRALERASEKASALENGSRASLGFLSGSRPPPPPPPLVADVSAVYDLAADEEDDVCPTCLEEYEPDNPRIHPKCGHDFHLACIYEWLERSPYCPVCATKMQFEEM